VAELADALDLGSSSPDGGWGFKSPLSHPGNIQRHPNKEHAVNVSCEGEMLSFL
jgi:hypothetical protein